MSTLKSPYRISESDLIEWTSPLIPELEMSKEDASASSIVEEYISNPDLNCNPEDCTPIKLIEQAKEVQLTEKEVDGFLSTFMKEIELFKEQESPTPPKQSIMPLFSPITKSKGKRRRSIKMTPRVPPTPFYTPGMYSVPASYRKTRRRLTYDTNVGMHPQQTPQQQTSSVAMSVVPKSWVDLYHNRPVVGDTPETMETFASEVAKVALSGSGNANMLNSTSIRRHAKRSNKMTNNDKENTTN